MAEHSKIEWTDATWNIVTGCELVSPGCTNCYAMKLASSRLRNHPSRAGLTQETKAGPVWTGEVRFNPNWLDQPLRWRRPRMIFVAAHGDLFHPGVTDEQLDQVFAVMALCPQHTFQVLTKRPERARAYLSGFATDDGRLRMNAACDAVAEAFRPGSAKPTGIYWANWFSQCEGDQPLPNVWLGTSVENQHWAETRIPHLLETPAAVRWISAEPLLGPLDLEPFVKRVREWSNGWLNNYPFNFPKHQLDWVVAGGESGPRARPMHPDWARSLRDQCAAAGVPFFFKQWGSFAPSDPVSALFNSRKHRRGALLHREGRMITEAEVDVLLLGEGFDLSPFQQMIDVGKARAGRLLDGVEHNGVPA